MGRPGRKEHLPHGHVPFIKWFPDGGRWLLGPVSTTQWGRWFTYRSPTALRRLDSWLFPRRDLYLALYLAVREEFDARCGACRLIWEMPGPRFELGSRRRKSPQNTIFSGFSAKQDPIYRGDVTTHLPLTYHWGLWWSVPRSAWCRSLVGES